MSSPTPPRSAVRPRLVALEDRLTPYAATIDPQIDNAAAVNEVSRMIDLANSDGGPSEIDLWPGGVYTFDKIQVPRGDASALPLLEPGAGGKDDTVVIDGKGATLRRSSAGGIPEFRLLTVKPSTTPGASTKAGLTVENLTFENGQLTADSGAAVLVNDISATFDNVIFRNNRSGGSGGAFGSSSGASALPTITFTNTLFDSNSAAGSGGGAFLVYPSSFDRCTFTNNLAVGNGGGLGSNVAFGPDVTNSVFYGNRAGGSGGGFGASFGTLTESTVHGNQAASGGGVSGSIDTSYSTITGNTATGTGAGGFQSSLAPNLISTVIAGNISATPANDDLGGSSKGLFNSQGFNYVGVGPGNKFTSNPRDQLGTVAAPLDPKLGPLQNNGGPTLTRSPLPGSPLIDAGDVVKSGATDQRGYDRFLGSNQDIGAYEVQYDGFTDPANPVSSPSLAIIAGDRQVTGIDGIFATPLTVIIRDPYGNVPAKPDTVSFNGGAGATFPFGTDVDTDATGVAQAYAYATDNTGPFQVSVAGSSTPQTESFYLVTRPELGTITITGGDGQSGAVGATFPTPLQVQVMRLQADGTQVPLANTAVFFAQPPGSGLTPPAGTFTGGVSIIQVTTDANGFASVPVTANTRTGAFGVLASAGLYGTTGFTLTNVPAAPAAVTVVSGGGQTTPVLSPFDAPLVVRVTDAFGNPTPGVAVGFTSTTSPEGATVTFPNGGVAATDASGTASLAVGANNKVGSYTVSAAPAGVSTPATFALTNLFGKPGAISVVSGFGQTTAVGSNFADPLVVQVLDVGGNLLPNIPVAFSSPPSGARATFPNGATARTGADGVAGLTAAANTKAGSYSVTATAPGVAPVTFDLTNVAGGVGGITILSGGDQETLGGTAFANPILVRVTDSNGNPIAGVVPTFRSPASGAGAAFVVGATDATGVATATATANPVGGSYPVTVSAGPSSVVLNLINDPPPAGPPGPSTPLVRPATVVAVGTGEGTLNKVWVFPAGQSIPTEQFQPYDAGFAGGVRVAVARAPGAVRVLTAPGPGRFSDVRLFDATTGDQILSITPFEATFTGGMYVAAGDIDRDGYDDYIMSADVGGGPRVQVISGRTGAQLADFFGIADPNFRGGARVAVGDVNGDGTPDLIVSAGFGGGPRVAVFDGTTIVAGKTPVRLVADFFVFEQGLRNGVFVAAGDFDGDGKAGIVVGAGPGGSPRVTILVGSDFREGNQTRIADFYVGDTSNRGGARLAVKDLDGDGKADLVVGAGPGGGTRVTEYTGNALAASGTSPNPLTTFDPLSGFSGGVYVG